jgi:hypothetical protein
MAGPSRPSWLADPETPGKIHGIIRPKRYQKMRGLQRVKIVSILTKREGWVYKFPFQIDGMPM